ncbi:MAG TPA: hypothetical protein VF796_15305 [Humisphaera sp.]
MTDRDRKLAILLGGLGLVLAVLGGKYYFEERSALVEQIDAATLEKTKADQALTDRQRYARIYRQRQDQGLQASASRAEQHLLVAGSKWRQEAGVTFLTTDSGNKTKPEGGFERLEQKMTVTGTQAQVTRLLWDIETTDLPVKVSGLSLTAKEGQDALTATLTLAALCEPAPKSTPTGRTK